MIFFVIIFFCLISQIRTNRNFFTRMDRWAPSKIRGKFKATLGLGWLHLHLACLLVTFCFGSALGLWGILFLILSASVLPSQQLCTCSDNYVSASGPIHPLWGFQASVCVFWKFSFREVNWVHHCGKSPEPGGQSWGKAVAQPCPCALYHQANPPGYFSSFLWECRKALKGRFLALMFLGGYFFLLGTAEMGFRALARDLIKLPCDPHWLQQSSLLWALYFFLPRFWASAQVTPWLF